MPPSLYRNVFKRRMLSLIVSIGVLALVVLPTGVLEFIQSTAHAAATFTVNSTGDGADSNLNDGVCDDGTGHCTLRAAIQQANATPGADTVNFQIGSGVQTIAPGSPLPTVTDPVIIDGTTQPGFAGAPLIVLSGGNAVIGDGLSITAGPSTVRGLVINGFRGHGLRIEGGGGSLVAGNYFGTDAAGSARVFNLLDAVFISNSPNNTVGGTTAAARNVISGSGQHGVHIFGSASTGNTVSGNFVGTNAAGTARVSNQGDGVLILNASSNVIGGDNAAARNLISGNISNGVEVQGDSAASANVIKGNYVGTNADGTAPLGNTGDGVHVAGLNNVVGGLTPTPGTAPGNLISGQFTNVFVFGTGTLIQGNLIGTDASGTAKLFNGSFGITCWGPQTTIGGTQAGARNVISGSGSGSAEGIDVANSGTAVIQGNFIGTDISGSAAIGNRAAGIEVDNFGVTIGGTTPAAANVISGNGTGINLRGGVSTVQGNLIGTDATGTSPLGNVGEGVLINFNAHNSTVGGDSAGAGNVIAFNGGAGISVAPDSFVVGNFTSANTLRGNSVFSNALLGIDLVAPVTPPNSFLTHDGLTLNDPGDSDAGPNGLQNSPVVLSATTSGGTTSVQGKLNSKPNVTFTVDFYANAVCDASGAGEGQSFAGSTTATTDANGDATFSASFPASSAGQIITATATDAAGNTSEFSVCNLGSAPGTAQFASASYAATEHDGAATITVTRTLGTASAATVDYATSDGTALAGQDYTATSGTISFAAGETTKTFSIPVTNDTLNEDGETVNLKLSNPTGGISLGVQSAAVLTIIDDDPPPVVAFLGGKAFGGTVFVAEGNSGTTDAVFTAALSAPSGKTVSVNFNTADGTAQSPGDYQAASGTLVFNPGETTKTVAVAVNGDTTPEPDESFTLSLSNPVNATFPQFQPIPFAVGVIWDDDSPGIHFSAPNYVVNEKDGSTTISVVRRGDASAAASVDYTATGIAAAPSANDTDASNRADFTPAFGTLRFAPGESEKSFTVLVNDDAFVENPETVSLALSNPSDAPQGTVHNANLTIISDDTGAPTAANNPVDGAQFFVRQHYHDFLNREPDSSGLDFWTGGITSCGADGGCTAVKKVNTSAAFFLSIEFQQTGYLVERIYKTAYGDATGNSTLGGPHQLSVPVVRLDEFLRDTQEVGSTPAQVVVGQGNWQQQLEENKNAFALEFVSRQRFADAFPASMTADAFVNQLNANAGRVLTPADISQLDSAFGGPSASSDDAAKRAQVLRSVAENVTLQQQESDRAFVLMQYIGYLRRNPNDAPDSDYTGYDFWLSKLDQFHGNFVQAEMVKAFITSTEYRQRFGQP
jgi:CSLREA domain-containing protein